MSRAILSRVTGRHIVYQQIAPQQLKEGLLQAGLPEDYADFQLLILSYFARVIAKRWQTA